MRAVLGVALSAVLLAAPVAQAEELPYRGYSATIDNGISGSKLRKLVRSTRCQIDVVESVGLPTRTTDFFRTVRFAILSDVANGHYSEARGVRLNAKQLDSSTPVLLHEFLHAFQHERMTPEQRRSLTSFYERARAGGEFPAKSYMLSNEGEFFAMTASTYLYGRIQRDPDTREKLRQAMPAYYRWLGDVLGVPEGALVPAGATVCG